MRSLLFALLLALLTAIRPCAYGQTFETLFSDNQGRVALSHLIQASDGNFYGTSGKGGANDSGTIFRVTPEGVFTTLVSFNERNGSDPRAGLVEGSDGNFYGTTVFGGSGRVGTVFKVTPSGVLTTLVSFNHTNGSLPSAALVEGVDGNFYGTTRSGGPSGAGTVFKVTPSGVLTTLVAFNHSNGSSPMADLIEGSDGSFYGSTAYGGPDGEGTIFRMTPSGVLTTLVSFNDTNGSNPSAALVEGTDGNFYGTTASGGAGDVGTVFKMTPNGTLITLVAFDSNNGRFPNGKLVEGSDGNFYGVTPSARPGSDGSIFRVTPGGQLTTLHFFSSSNGSYPRAGLIEGSDGNFYGTTNGGEASGDCTIFKMTPSGELDTLVILNRANGSKARGEMVEGDDGNFYGTTYEGGTSGQGTVFRITPSGDLTTLVSFGSVNGSKPGAQLVKGNDGNFYGVTDVGGSAHNGTIFKVTPQGALTTMVHFNRINGARPSGLMEASDGNFYGTTREGGSSNHGTVFRMTPAGELATLASFTHSSNGSSPRGGLIEGSDGNFYGTTEFGVVSGYGTVFRMTPSGVLTTLATFESENGRYPSAGLVEGLDGNFYGTTSEGGAANHGTVFKVTPTGVLTTLVSFTSKNGSYPRAGLVEGKDGNFYGTTWAGGAGGFGSVFKVTPAGVLSTLYSFDGVVAANPERTPIFGSDGKLYSTAEQMVVWRLTVPMVPAVTIIPPSAITTSSATLSGTVDARRADTVVTFEYGLSTAYGSSIVASPGTVTGWGATAVSATLSGLAPHTTYYYRLVASNSEGTGVALASFTTANGAPAAVGDTFTPAADELGAMTLPVLENDSDPDGDPLTIVAVGQGALGVVSTDGATITYTPRPGFVGRDAFRYTISDGFDTATAHVELWAAAPFTRVLFSKGSEVPGAGQDGSGIPEGTRFKRFGVPSLNSGGKLAFTASYGAPGRSGLSVFGFEPEAVKGTLVARKGQTAPGTEAALFSSFTDPLLNEGGNIAFLGTVSGGDTTKRNNQGIWVASFSEVSGLGVELVARTGTQPPGAPAGARWKSFTSVALSCGGGGDDAEADGGGWWLAFTGFMRTGAGGVKQNNDMGLWIASRGKMTLAFREGQKLYIGETEKQLRGFAALKVLPAAPGQGNGVTSGGGVAVQAFFTDGSQALLRVSNDSAGDGVVTEILALPEDAVVDLDETAGSFGLPTQSQSGRATAWVGTLRGKGNPGAILQHNQSDLGFLESLARKGDVAPGIEGATFSAFRGVAVNDSGGALFSAKVTGKGISKANDDGLWWRQSRGGDGSLQLLAREGAQPPGAPEGALWSTFTSLALPEGQYGPLFTARIVGIRKKAMHSWGGSVNDQGLWAVDSEGELRLIVHEGQEVHVEGQATPKTLKSFTVLSAVPGSAAQRRSFDDDGQIVYRAVFTDGSQAIVKVQVP